MATIKDVARLAGVSVATVSRVINNSPKASEASRQSVGAAMETLNYHPNANARALAVSFPTRTLGGRDVGMERHYAEWMEARVPEGFAIAGRFADGNELFYILKEG